MNRKKVFKNKKDYFNTYETNRLFELSKVNPEVALLGYEDYIYKYPHDYFVRTYYITTLMTLKFFEKAKEEIMILESLIISKKLYNEADSDRLQMLCHNLDLCKLKYYSYTGDYDNLKSLYFDKAKEFDYMGKLLLFYCTYCDGNNLSRDDFDSYMAKQIIEYREEDFREHIKKHLADYNENDMSISKSYFLPDFDIELVIEEVKKYIPSEKKLCFGYYEDIYIFKYDECGKDNNRLVNYFKVVTFCNSLNFITMCPSNYCENLPFVDLNYLKEKDESNIKVKRLSQIDKFNKRYGR